jgi:hypothetical protein
MTKTEKSLNPLYKERDEMCLCTWHSCAYAHGTLVLMHMALLCLCTWHSCAYAHGTLVLMHMGDNLLSIASSLCTRLTTERQTQTDVLY